MAKTVIGRLSAILSLNSAQFSKGMKRANMATGRFRGNVKSAGAMLQRFGRIMAATFVTGTISRFVKSTIDANDAIVKTAEKLGIEVNQLLGLHRAAQLAGVSTKVFDMALQRMVRRIDEASQGFGEARKSLSNLGLNVKELATLAPDEQFLRVAEAMQRFEHQGRRIQLTMKLVDSEGVAVVNMFKDGRKAIEDAIEGNRRLGRTLNMDTIKRLVEARDAMTDLKIASMAFGTALITQLANHVQTISEAVGKWATRLSQMTSDQWKAIGATAKWAVRIAAAAVAIKAISAAVRAATAALKAYTVVKAMALGMLGPAGWAMIAGGLAAGGAAAYGVSRLTAGAAVAAPSRAPLPAVGTGAPGPPGGGLPALRPVTEILDEMNTKTMPAPVYR